MCQNVIFHKFPFDEEDSEKKTAGMIENYCI